MTINTILFDLDGTLVNTNPLIIASFQHILNKYCPNQYTLDDIYSFIGPRLEETCREIDANRADELVAEYRKFGMEHHDLLVKEYDTVYETVKTLKEKGFRLGIVTTKIGYMAVRAMKQARLDTFFDVVVAGDDVDNPKPNPEPIEKALALLGADKSEAIMVGDNVHDIEGGKNAGVATAGVAWTIIGRGNMAGLKPDFLLDKMSDLLEIVGA